MYAHLTRVLPLEIHGGHKKDELINQQDDLKSDQKSHTELQNMVCLSVLSLATLYTVDHFKNTYFLRIPHFKQSSLNCVFFPIISKIRVYSSIELI